MTRLAGRIGEWDDERGFGFVAPNGGGERAFVHIKAFTGRSRRPVVGDIVSYLPARDPRGRLQANAIRFALQPARRHRRPLKLAQLAAVTTILIGVTAAVVFGWAPLLLIAICLFLSGVAYLMYGLDKRAAQRRDDRVPENTLHLLALLGGWPGALLAQQMFRHKTTKRSFRVVFWITVVLNVAALWWLVRSGTAVRLDAAIWGWVRQAVDGL